MINYQGDLIVPLDWHRQSIYGWIEWSYILWSLDIRNGITDVLGTDIIEGAD